MLLAELVALFLILKKHSRKQVALWGYIFCVIIMSVCLGILLFGEKTAPDRGLYNGFALFGFFGICRALGEACLMSGLLAKDN